MIKAECFWEILEIVIAIIPSHDYDGDKKPVQFVLHDHIDEDPRFRFGTSRHGSISLDIEQATKLANELIQSINEYNRIDSDCATSVSFDFENAARVCVKSSEAGKELRKLYVDNKK